MVHVRKKTGLTLVEMLVVVAIVAILATIVLNVAGHIDTQSKQRAMEASFALLDGALEQYYDYWGAYPDPNKPHTPPYPSRSAALYDQLYSTPQSRDVLEELSESLIRDNVDNLPEITDPWGTVLDYRYEPVDTFPTIISGGPDKNLVTVGDNMTNK